jgi:hypothetical protein
VVVTVVTGADYVLQAMRLYRSGPDRSGPDRSGPVGHSDLGEA